MKLLQEALVERGKNIPALFITAELLRMRGNKFKKFVLPIYLQAFVNSTNYQPMILQAIARQLASKGELKEAVACFDAACAIE